MTLPLCRGVGVKETPTPLAKSLENCEPKFVTNVGIEQKQVPMKSRGLFQTDFGEWWYA
jgi:hypothetical protein